MDAASLSPQVQRAMDALVAETARLEAAMGDRPPPQRASYLSHMTAKETFARVEPFDSLRDVDVAFSRLITASAVSLLTASLLPAK
jgi:hypothetical protein